MPEVRITSDGTLGNTHVFIDGAEIKGIQSLEWCTDANDGTPYLKMCLIPELITIDGEVKDIYTFAEGLGHKISSL